nr:MAG TPA: hypothetical protein [Caudoviricetes sp.]
MRCGIACPHYRESWQYGWDDTGDCLAQGGKLVWEDDPCSASAKGLVKSLFKYIDCKISRMDERYDQLVLRLERLKCEITI